jgi:prolipoprotein diacylglyceryltransferase
MDAVRDAVAGLGWLGWQIAAVVAATATLSLVVAPRERRLVTHLAVSWPAAAAGALALDPLLHLPALLLGRAAPLEGRAMAYGALAALVGAYAWLARRSGLDLRAALDRLAPSLGVLVAFARIGCFAVGCEHGAITGGATAVTYPPATPPFEAQLARGAIGGDASRSLGVHPTPLYEAALGIVLALGALWALRRAGRPGAAFAFVAVGYALGRAVLDSGRADAGVAAPASAWLGAAVVAGVLLAARASAAETR